ncbi:uncharacterized protein KIAA0040 homolog [Chanos chanos]|uniref:Uncharacterized protein KIAA0040 homolog n=1 Tax=Chanos chanos TaxID=29144 RepID=A0A6J2VJ49_CHACN|nr:uncharacterized protein KIAA0040 homolog [Chanos chanos]
MTDKIQVFFNEIWSLVSNKHNQGIYNTVCLVVLLALPLVMLFTAFMVCCHCCCCRRANCVPCCRRKDDTTVSDPKSEKKKKKKKNSSQKAEDLWISVKTEPMTPDRAALTMV